jgi:hypothetical protein
MNNIVVVSDTHIGCRLGLLPPEGVTLDDGGRYMPSTLQSSLWEYWRIFWDEFVPAATHGEPYTVVFNGDALDGVHHRSVTQWSHNLEDQRRVGERVLAPIVEKAERYYHIRGTEAHVGSSAQDEESLARSLGAIPNDEGQHARYELWIEMNKCLGHFLHHIGTTGSQDHRGVRGGCAVGSTYA